MSTKKNIAFISYSRKDKELANDIRHLLEQTIDHFNLSDKVFMDKDLYNYDEKWRKGIIKGLEESHCIIPIFTTNSINQSSWISFELGASEVYNIPKFPIVTAGVDVRDIPCCDSQAYCLINVENVYNFVRKILELKNSLLNEKKLEDYIFDNSCVKRIIKKSRERWVYIIGSKPEFNDEQDKEKLWEKKVDSFLTKLTHKLFEKGYSLTSFPIVKHVGEVVIRETAYKNKVKNYKIAGLYSIDKELRNLSQRYDIDESNWKDILSNFRKTYLDDKEFIIIIGGKEGTREEYSAAKSMNINNKFIPLPCFYGFGEKLWTDEYTPNPQESFLNYRTCNNCNSTDSCNKIEEIVALLK